MASSREAISNIVDYYSYLFTFPSRWVVIASILATTGVVGAVSFGLAYGFTGLIQGLIFGLGGLAAPIIASDLVTEKIHGGDPLLTPRRINIVSFVWCLAAGCLMAVSGMISGFTGNPHLLLRGVVLAVFSSASLRLLIFSVFSTRRVAEIAFITIVQPLLLIAATYLLEPATWLINPSVLLVILSLILLGPVILLVRVSRWSFNEGTLRIIPLFRAFVYAWAGERNEPLEDQLAEISESRTLEADSIAFSDPSGRCLGRLVVPYVHPGPFRNVGSSGLSLTLSEGLNGGCETLVAHGVSNHEWDMARSRDMEKIVSALKGMSPSTYSKTCGPMMRAEIGGAKASCQLLGKVALFTLTLSPKSHDDIQDSVKSRIRDEASRRGLTAVVVDAHNCLDELDLLDEKDADNLVSAATEALYKAVKIPQSPFRVGFSRIKPSEWGLDEGMGPCGIGAILFEVAAKRYVYLVFDSNNMIEGLRERLVDRLTEIGYVGSEIMTSDTHLVNAIGATEKGYHPAGEVMDEDRLLAYIDEALKKAQPQTSDAAFTRICVEDIRIIGVNGIKTLREVVRTSFRVFITTAATTLPLTFLAAALVAFLV